MGLIFEPSWSWQTEFRCMIDSSYVFTNSLHLIRTKIDFLLYTHWDCLCARANATSAAASADCQCQRYRSYYVWRIWIVWLLLSILFIYYFFFFLGGKWMGMTYTATTGSTTAPSTVREFSRDEYTTEICTHSIARIKENSYFMIVVAWWW